MRRAGILFASLALLAVLPEVASGDEHGGCGTIDRLATDIEALIPLPLEATLDPVCPDPAPTRTQHPGQPGTDGAQPRARTNTEETRSTGPDPSAPAAARDQPAPRPTTANDSPAAPLSIGPGTSAASDLRPTADRRSSHRARDPWTAGAIVAVALASLAVGARIGRDRFVRAHAADHMRLARMKDHLLGNVSHELRTPLAAALGYARLLKRDGLSPRASRAFLDAVVTSCEKLERTIDLLIDVAALEGHAVDQSATVPLGPLGAASAARWRERAPSHVLAVREDAPDLAVAASRSLLEHALDELIDNAVKFSPGGGLVTIAIGAEGSRARIAVSDQGIGIADEERARIFEDFGQSDDSPTRRFGGLGLGLGLVRRVAHTYAGTVEVASEPGHGSTFTLVLPSAPGLSVTHAPGRPRSLEAAPH